MAIKKKAQSAVEMLVLVGFMLVLFTIFFVFVSNKMVDVQKQNDVKLIEQFAGMIKTELEIASVSEDGYRRTLALPPQIGGFGYYAQIVTAEMHEKSYNYSTLLLSYENHLVTEQFVFVVPRVMIEDGNLNKGESYLISKESGAVYIDSVLVP